MAMTFQTPALWPHRTVHGNVAFGLEARGVSIREREMRVAAALRQVRLEGVADALPQTLSGGQQQRVALARALAVAPRLLLLDEPLSQLDPALRAELRQELRRLHGELGITVVHVTHDPREAMALGTGSVSCWRGVWPRWRTRGPSIGIPSVAPSPGFRRGELAGGHGDCGGAGTLAPGDRGRGISKTVRRRSAIQLPGMARHPSRILPSGGGNRRGTPCAGRAG